MVNTNEIMKIRVVDYNFTVIRPGGNDTCLVMADGNIPQQDERGRINNFIQEAYPNIEQVGFVNIDPANAELMMAGGEFCGNATRSTAWLALNGKPGDMEIQVSGVKGKLKAGVTNLGEAYAQMPIYPDPQRIVSDPECPGNVTVEMEGITHYVDFDTDQIKGLSKEEIKKKARTEMTRRGLDQGLACGIIYAEKVGDSWAIYPVVLVANAGGENKESLYYETACGSGTTALGLVLSLISKQSVKDVPIIQPSGMTIKISVDFDGKYFQYAQIQGKVEELNKGNVEIEENAGIVTEQINTVEKLRETLSNGNLSFLYQDIFSKPPYFEKFGDKEIEEIFAEYVTDGLLFLTKNKSEVIGFGAALPIESVPELSKILQDAGRDTTDGWYMADLGVKEEYRRKGIARKLVKSRLDVIPKGSKIFIRTSINNIASQALYRSLGFKLVPNASQEVTDQRIDGSVQTDKRIFLEKTI
jgi:diaminopimelate epimerase/ribosomal protein S18 acetylase RimI-like enzyme